MTANARVCVQSERVRLVPPYHRRLPDRCLADTIVPLCARSIAGQDRMIIEKLDVSPDLLGESPVWDPASRRLFWIDAWRGLVRQHLRT